jgi:hypothetical protein
MPERLPEVPASPQIVSCLDGQVYLASAHGPGCGTVVAAGFGHEDALTRARTRARALDDLYRLRTGPESVPGGRRLRLADFVASPIGDGRFAVAGQGVASGARYLLPVEVVWLGERACGVVPTAVGVVEDPADPVSSAIADVLAGHVMAGWWGHPRIPLLRVTGQLRHMTSPAEAAGLAVSGYVLPGADFQTALVCIAGGQRGPVFGIAAGRLVSSAAPVAFLRALAARLRPSGDPAAHHLAWRCRAADIAWLERSALEADLTRADELAFWEGLPDWADIARRQFGHEPVLFSSGRPGRPAKVVCPGASCYRAPG